MLFDRETVSFVFGGKSYVDTIALSSYLNLNKQVATSQSHFLSSLVNQAKNSSSYLPPTSQEQPPKQAVDPSSQFRAHSS
jgi:hypothetical protein